MKTRLAARRGGSSWRGSHDRALTRWWKLCANGDTYPSTRGRRHNHARGGIRSAGNRDCCRRSSHGTTQLVAAPPTTPPAPTPAAGPKQGVTLTNPRPGEGVATTSLFQGTVSGPLSVDEHLWIFVGPVAASDNWWVHPREVVPDPSGAWQMDVYFGGPIGMRHRIIMGIADAATNATIQRHLFSSAGQPLPDGIPRGVKTFIELQLLKDRE